MTGDLVVVWGNCQAAPLADLLRAPLTRAGLRVVDVPAVYLAGPADLAELHPLLAQCAAFVTQPVREAAYGGGRGSDTLIDLLPPGATVVHLPVTYDTSAFPFQVHGHGADGERVPAPLTDYHDVRAALAATRGLPADEAARWWPAPAAEAVRANAAASRAELRRRERELDVATSDLLDAPDALWTMTHPGNRTLAAIADRIRDTLRGRGLSLDAEPITAPAREYLAERVAPLERAVVDALGWPAASVRADWTIRGEHIPRATVLAAHLELYAARPDVAADIVARHAGRPGLDPSPS